MASFDLQDMHLTKVDLIKVLYMLKYSRYAKVEKNLRRITSTLRHVIEESLETPFDNLVSR